MANKSFRLTKKHKVFIVKEKIIGPNTSASEISRRLNDHFSLDQSGLGTISERQIRTFCKSQAYQKLYSRTYKNVKALVLDENADLTIVEGENRTPDEANGDGIRPSEIARDIYPIVKKMNNNASVASEMLNDGLLDLQDVGDLSEHVGILSKIVVEQSKLAHDIKKHEDQMENARLKIELEFMRLKQDARGNTVINIVNDFEEESDD